MPPFPSTQSYILRSTRRGGALGWAIAAGALVLAVALRVALDAHLGDSVSFVMLFGAVAIAVWIAGAHAAVVCALIGYLAWHYLFVEPRYVFSFDDARTVAGIVAYALTCGLIIAIGEAARSAQARAHARGELLRVTLATIDDAIIATDVDSSITYLNESAEVLTGWSCMEAIGHPLNAIFRLIGSDAEDASSTHVMPESRTSRRAESARRAVLLGRDAVAHPIEHSVAPIKGSDGMIAGCVVTFRDVSARQRLEREEAEAACTARLLASIVESTDDAIISTSLDGIIQTWNAGAERVFGYAPAEMIDQHISRIIPTDRFEQEEALIAATLTAGHRVEHFETERVHKSGRRVLVSLTISPIKNDAGNVIGASRIARDTTRQRAIATSTAARKSSRRVLVVDDNHDCASSLARLLRLDGHAAFMAHDGAEALDSAERHRPDVVFLDIDMPILNGYEVCRRLRARSYGKDMLIIALTGCAQDSDRRRAHEAGFDEHFVKPANYSALASVLETGAARVHC